MPEVHFTGTLKETSNIPAMAVSVTWAVVPGNSAWALQEGKSHGETHVCEANGNKKSVLDLPVELHYSTSTSEGWPMIVFEVWDRSLDGLRGFCGCGSAWLPSAPGRHLIDTCIWKPATFDDGLIPDDAFLPCIPDLTALRQYILKSNARCRLQSATVGDLTFEIYTTTADFESHGVQLS